MGRIGLGVLTLLLAPVFTFAGDPPEISLQSEVFPALGSNAASREQAQTQSEQESAGLLAREPWLFFTLMIVALQVAYLFYRNGRTRRQLISQVETYRRENQELKTKLQNLRRREQIQTREAKPETAAALAACSSLATSQERRVPACFEDRQVRRESHSAGFPSAPISRDEHFKKVGGAGRTDSSSPPEKAHTLLENLSERFGIEPTFSTTTEPRWEPSETHAQKQSQPTANSAPTPETSLSDYMDYLLKTYSSNPPRKAAPAKMGTPAPARQPNPPNRCAGTVRNLKDIPRPVSSHDPEGMRSQIEALRETSNLNAANALRQASSRRRRQRLARWGKISAVLLAAYVATTILVR